MQLHTASGPFSCDQVARTAPYTRSSFFSRRCTCGSGPVLRVHLGDGKALSVCRVVSKH